MLYIENEVRSIVVCVLFLLLQHTHGGVYNNEWKKETKQVYEYKAMIQKWQRNKIRIFHKV